MTLNALLLKLPEQLAPTGTFTTPTQLITCFVESADEVLKLTATDEAAAVLSTATELPCPVTLTLRLRSVSLAELTNGARKGRAYKLRIIGAQLAGGKRGA